MGEVSVRLATVAIDSDDALTLLNRHATESDRAEADKHVRSERRRQTLVGRAALRHLLAQTTGVDGARWHLERDAAGRPVARHPDGKTAPSISLSHAGSWVACVAASAGEIGIDIEVVNGRRDANAIAGFLSSIERMAVAREGEAALLDFWTLREAVAKARGATVLDALALDGIEIAGARGRIGIHRVAGDDWLTGQHGTPSFHLAACWRMPVRPSTGHLRLFARAFETIAGPETGEGERA